ncbi:MAG: hypothetical protein AAF449_08740 [Myxococcota bacterium]
MASETSEHRAGDSAYAGLSSLLFRFEPLVLDAMVGVLPSTMAIGLLTGITGWISSRHLTVGVLVGLASAIATFILIWYRWVRPLVSLTMAAREGALEASVGGQSGWGHLVAALQRMQTSSVPKESTSDALAMVEARGLVVEAIRAMGQGRAHPSLDALPDDFASLRTAIRRARQDFEARTRGLHRTATDMARDSSAVAVGVRNMAAEWGAQKEDLDRLANRAEDAAVRVRSFEARNKAAVDAIRTFERAYKKREHELHGRVLELSRYVRQVRDASARTRVWVEADEKFGRVFDAAIRWLPSSTAVSNSADEVAVWVGEARAAQATLRMELSALCFDLDTLGEELRDVSQRPPPPVVDIESQTTRPLIELGDALLLALEINLRAVRAVSLHATRCHDGAEQVARNIETLVSRTPQLVASMTHLELNDGFEVSLVRELERLHDHARDTGPDGLTPTGRQVLRRVLICADRAQTRIVDLLRATDEAVSSIRSG